jgi:hypothetical protein
VLTLDPLQQPFTASGVPECFHGWNVIDRADATERREEVAAELLRWVTSPWQEGAIPCFFPHHGIILRTAKDALHFAICYACGIAKVYRAARKHEFGEFRASLRADAMNALLEGLGLAMPAYYLGQGTD